ncbi:MAG: VCBS repeat-containing protein [Verrucomicrobiota bacterium]
MKYARSTGFSVYFTPCLILSALTLILFSCSDSSDRPWQAHAISIAAENAEEIVAVALVDLNRDGRPEVLASRENSTVIYVYVSYHSAEDGLLWKQHRIPAVANIRQFYLWEAGTRDRPERLLVVTTGNPSRQVLYSSLPKPEMALEAGAWDFTEIPIPTGYWPAIYSGDFNNDGISDLALAGRSINIEQASAPTVIWMSDAHSAERSIVTIGASADPLLIVADDVEKDGDIDLLVVDAAPGSNSMGAYWLENPWPENPEVEWKQNFITLSSLKPAGAAIVDFDGDQHLDLLICLQEKGAANRLMCFKKVLAATEVAWLPLPLPVPGRQASLKHPQIADLDQDGFNDLVLGYVSAPDPLEHLLWLRNPTPEAASPAWLRRTLSSGSQGTATSGILLHDLDRDGDTDVISADAGGALRWYENTVPAVTVDLPSDD